MNVIFIDFDGVLYTISLDKNGLHETTFEDLERRIKILSEICKEYNCKVVIESSSKDLIDEDTLEVKEGSFVNEVFDLFKKYNIECIGRTPNVRKKLSEHSYLDMWKEDEIILYLKRHPEIEHFCIIDDDDAPIMRGVSDLDKVRDHLVVVDNRTKCYEEQGLLPKHKEDVGKILKIKRKLY